MSNEPHDMIATAIETEGSGCDHREPTCSDCLADVAIGAIGRYLDQIAGQLAEMIADWYGRAVIDADRDLVQQIISRVRGDGHQAQYRDPTYGWRTEDHG